MDPSELIRHAPQMIEAGATVAGAIKFTDIIKSILGPATAEIAERVRDEARLYRYERQLKCLKKAEKMAEDARFTPKAVPVKLLFPLLEGASLEEDENLHTMWAALLANAASPLPDDSVRAGFIAILKAMDPDEAAVLRWIYEKARGSKWQEEQIDRDRLDDLYAELFVERYSSQIFQTHGDAEGTLTMLHYRLRSKCGMCLDGLEASQLIRGVRGDDRGHRSAYSVTYRGYLFMQACTPPGKQQS